MLKLNELLSHTEYIKITLRQIQTGHLVFDVKLNKKDALFLLDTGASGTILSEKGIEKFQLDIVQTEETGTSASGSDIVMQLAKNNCLAFEENLELEDLEFFVMNLNHVNNSFDALGEKNIDGVLGADILSSRKCIIDYENVCFYLKKPITKD